MDFSQTKMARAGLAILLLLLTTAQLSGSANADDGMGSLSGKEAAPVPHSAIQVFLPTILEKGKPAWGSIYGNNGTESLADQGILVNGVEIKSDDYGSFNFIAPATDTLRICLPEKNGTTEWEQSYKSTARGLLVSDESAADLIDKLDSLTLSSGSEPIISHAPSVVEVLQTVVVVGKNFSGKQGEDDLEIGDRNADILAASPRCIVAVSNKQMKIGPIKELRVSSHEQNSLPVDVDVCRLDMRPDTSNSGGKKKLKISLFGTTLPALISLTNTSKSNLRFGGWRLGTQNIFLSPGGMQNSFLVEPSGDISDAEVNASVISNSLFDPYSLKASRTLLTKAVLESEEDAEIIRLKRRAIALEAQVVSINKERQTLLQSGKMNLEDESKLETSGKSASARLYRVERMLQSRRAVIESYGSSEYEKLVDTANNGGISSLDSVLANRDLGFTESRLLKVVGKRAEEQRQALAAETNAWNYTRYYPSPSSQVLDKYRKKYGKRGYVPPPPSMALIPPPAPFRPNMNDLGPVLLEIPKPLKLTPPQDKRGSKKQEKHSSSARNKSPGSKSAKHH